MYPKIIAAMRAAVAFVKKPWVRRIGQILALAACLWYILKNWSNLLEAARSLTLPPLTLLGSLLCCLLALTAGIFSWYFLLRGLGYKLPLAQAAFTHLRPVLSKYIPGYAWQYLGKGFLSSEAGVPKRIIAIGFALEFVLVIWSGAGLGMILFPPTLASVLPPTVSRSFGVGIVGLLFVVLIASPMLLRFLVSRLPSRLDKNHLPDSLSRTDLFYAVIAIFTAWLAHGCAFWLTSGFYGPLHASSFLEYTAAYTLAFLAGWLIIIIPNGLGVREGVLALLLADKAPAAIILSAAVVFRFIQLGGDLIGYLLSIPLFRRKLSQ